MTDRPIIFSAPMVRALLAGKKTQTRRLATSPLRKCVFGDRLYVREAWRTHKVSDELSPRLLTGEGRIWFEADRDVCDQHGKLRPAIHMPRWASRLTLIVEAVSFQQLSELSREDILAEGCPIDPWYRDTTADGSCPYMVSTGPDQWESPSLWYHRLWDSLHGRDSWETNPQIVALTFRVERGNIDRFVP